MKLFVPIGDLRLAQMYMNFEYSLIDQAKH